MPEKGVNFLQMSNTWATRSSPVHQWRFGLLTALGFTGMVMVWSINGCGIKSFLENHKFQQDFHDPFGNLNHTQRSLSHSLRNSSPKNSTHLPINMTQMRKSKISSVIFHDPDWKREGDEDEMEELKWMSAELEPNFTANLLARLMALGRKRYKDSRLSSTVDIKIPGLDRGKLVDLSAGEIHEFLFQAIDDSGNAQCVGGDYFETDLSGESWKSRPPVKDVGNGSYSVSLQVHPDFAGDYNLTIILLFRHFEGLKISPARFVYDRVVRHIRIRFNWTKARLPDLVNCRESDFRRDVWLGRWTRHGKNDNCRISHDGRYRCLATDYPCSNPWCNGSLGALESNGWVYSSHCSFKLFSGDSGWNCLKNRWIFLWGDSNHVDTVRNMLNFILDLPEVQSVQRRFDMNFSNPKDSSQSVRITSIFNGHSNESKNYEGLDSLKDEGYRNLLKNYFAGKTVPDTLIMNSGLHDGVRFSNVRAFSASANFAVSFWKEVMDSVVGSAIPRIIFRSTVATGGYARSLAFNPEKMEVFNGVLLEKLKRAGLISGVVDDFDMTFPWHFDNRCNDGVHYGRAPSKMKWRDGEIGHQYFVDLMLGHVLLNALCAAR